MKRVFVFLAFLMITATTAIFAQCIEVKLVETKVIESERNFVITNNFDFRVVIEAEIWQSPRERRSRIVPKKIVQKQTFELDPGEEYVWKTSLSDGDKGIFCVKVKVLNKPNSSLFCWNN